MRVPKEVLSIQETANTYEVVVKLYEDGSVTLIQGGDIVCLTRETAVAIFDFLFNRVEV